MTRASLLLMATMTLLGCTPQDGADVDPSDAPVAAERPLLSASSAIRRPDVPEDAPDADPDTAAHTGAVAPTVDCVIVSPANDTVFEEGVSVYFSADLVADDPEGVRLIWSSDPYGTMVLGNDFGFILPPGEHRIHVEGLGADGGACADEVRIVVGSAAP